MDKDSDDIVVKESTRKRKADKAAFEAETVKRAAKGKGPAPVPHPKNKASFLDVPARKHTALKIGESAQPLSQPSSQPRSVPVSQPRTVPTFQPSHCSFNLAAYKAAKMAKNGTEGSSSNQ